MKLGLSLVMISLLFGCASGNCRQLSNTNAAGTNTATTAPAPGADTAAKPATAKPDTVVVYKADGSLQCAMGKPVSVEAMEAQLSGIQVVAREKKSDGMMHIQVCGSPTGMMNTYTIPTNRLSDAEKRGFKKWNF